MIYLVDEKVNFVWQCEIFSMITNSVYISNIMFCNINFLLLDDTDVLIADNDCINEIEEVVKPVVPISSILKDVKMAKRKRSYPWGNEILPVDAERNLNKTCILELIAENYFMKRQKTIGDKDVFELPSMVNLYVQFV